MSSAIHSSCCLQFIYHVNFFNDLSHRKLVQKSEADKQRIQNLQSAERQALEQVEDLKVKLEKTLQTQVSLKENAVVHQSQTFIFVLFDTYFF